MVITDEANGPSSGTIIEYANREAAEAAIRQYLAYLQVQGSAIDGDIEYGYTAIRWEHGRLVSTRIVLGQVQ